MIGKSLWPINDTWNYHCTASKSSMGKLDRLQEMVKSRYGAPSSLDDFLHKADLANYESTRAMFEAFRVNTPASTGIVQWMLNSARPGIYWQLYDHYGQPNAAYYSVKKGNAPLQLIYDYASHDIKAVNGTLRNERVNANMRLYATDGKLLNEKSAHALVSGQSHEKLFTVPEVKGNAFLFLTLTNEKGDTIATNDYVLAERMDEYDWEASDWITTPIKRYADYKSLASLAKAELRAKAIASHKDGKTRISIELTNTGKAVALLVRLALTDRSGNLVAPAHYNDNYVTLAPGEHRTITCDLPKRSCLKGLRLSADGWNISRAQNINIK